MKVYKVYDGKVISIEVEKITPKKFFIKPVAEFHYYRTLEREHACTSEKEAVLENLNKAKERYGMFRDRMLKEQDNLEKAMSLAKEYGV